jgi:hypothetical protein
MCLKTVSKTKLPPRPDHMEVWYKVLRTGWDMTDAFTTPYKGKKIVIGKCYEDKSKGHLLSFDYHRYNDKRPTNDYYRRTEYPKGFHLYTKAAAKEMQVLCSSSYNWDYLVVECCVWNIVAYGTDHYGQACVARSMRPMEVV